MSNSIFGVQAPQFKVGSHIIELDHIIFPMTEQFDYGDIIHQSVFTKHRVWTDMGDHYLLRMIMQLFKYSDPSEKYTELKLYYRTLGELWRRRDGQVFRNKEGNIVLFRFNKLSESFLTTINYPDILELEFISQDPIDIATTLENYVP